MRRPKSEVSNCLFCDERKGFIIGFGGFSSIGSKLLLGGIQGMPNEWWPSVAIQSIVEIVYRYKPSVLRYKPSNS